MSGDHAIGAPAHIQSSRTSSSAVSLRIRQGFRFRCLSLRIVEPLHTERGRPSPSPSGRHRLQKPAFPFACEFNIGPGSRIETTDNREPAPSTLFRLSMADISGLFGEPGLERGSLSLLLCTILMRMKNSAWALLSSHSSIKTPILTTSPAEDLSIGVGG